MKSNTWINFPTVGCFFRKKTRLVVRFAAIPVERKNLYNRDNYDRDIMTDGHEIYRSDRFTK